MKKAPIIIIFVVVFLGVTGWGVYNLPDDEQEKGKESEEMVSGANEEAEKEELVKQREEIQGVITEDDLAAFNEEGLNPFGKQTAMSELSDNTYQEYIHGMSHQKVKASKKWGFYEIHPQRIQWLLEGLDKIDLKHEDVYRDILVKWSSGDFSSADHGHNTIWSLQGGTVGKATGILSQEEEQEYVGNKGD